MRILITGSRDWDKVSVIDAILAQYAPDRPIIVHGGCRGADQMADVIARRLGLPTEEHKAHWSRYGKSAGFVRNKAMVGLGADLCFAFIKNGSRGATMCADLAEGAGILTVRVYEPAA